MRHQALCLSAVALVWTTGCARVSGLIEGRVEADVAGHHMVVTDCYRTSPPAPRRLADEGGLALYEYAPCRDAVILLRGAELSVNGIGYGPLGAGDELVVDHGRVSIKRRHG